MFLPRDSWLHWLDPRTKLWFVLLAGTVALLYSQIGVLFLLLMLSQLAILSARIPANRLSWLWTRLTPLLVMILILQPIFSPGTGQILLQLGPIRITISGILEGISFALRAAALTFLSAAMLLTTDPDQLVQGLVKVGLPYPWGLTIGLSIRYLPTMYGLFTGIGEAQQARGWILDERNLPKRVRSYLPVLVATIIAALRMSDSLGLALAARGLGYPARRTVLNDVSFAAGDWLGVVITTMAFVGMIALRFGMGFGSTPL